MSKLTKNIVIRSAAVAFVLSLGVVTNASAVVTRLSGLDRYSTSDAIVNAGWAGGAETAVLASGLDSNKVDALTVAPLAKAKNAPVVLVNPKDSVQDIVAKFIALNTKTVYIASGTGVISTQVEEGLKAAGIVTVIRLGGVNRYETALNIAKLLSPSTSIVIANGQDAHLVDSLSIAPIAATKGMPIFLAGSSIDAATIDYIDSLDVNTTYVLGGTGVVSDEEVKKLPGINRLAGSGRYETNAKVVDTFKTDAALDLNNIFITSGENANLIDALAGAPLAASKGAPIIFIHDTINSNVKTLLNSIVNKTTEITELGGLGAITKAAEDAINTIQTSMMTTISLNKTTDSLVIGGKDNIIPTINPISAANKEVTWTSSDASIVTVDATGNIIAVGIGTAIITVTAVDGVKPANCTVTVNNKKGYVHNPELGTDLNVRADPSLTGAVQGYLYNYQTIEILDTIDDVWDKIIYNNDPAYVYNAYIKLFTSPSDSVVNTAKNITKQFEAATPNQIAGNFDGQGLSLGYLQWCISQGTLQPILNRMDRQYTAEMKSIFGTNYTSIHNMTLDTPQNQLKWAISINNSTNKIIDPWNSQFVSLCKNQHFISIEADAEVFMVNKAMIICDEYNLKTVRGFALAFDIAVQNGSVSTNAMTVIATALGQNPNMTEKTLLGVIANAVIDSSDNITKEDIRSRKMAIVNGQGTVHSSMLYLDKNYGLSDNDWR